MKKLRKKAASKTHKALSVSAVLCFIAFLTNFASAIADGKIDNSEMHQLLANVDGFETVLLVLIMMVIGRKKK